MSKQKLLFTQKELYSYQKLFKDISVFSVTKNKDIVQ